MTDPQASTIERVLGESEPVRRALYPFLVAVVALLVGYGLVDAERAPLWIALAVAICGPASIEAARAVAFAPATVDDQTVAWQAALDDEYARGVSDATERTPERVAHELLDDEPGQHAADRDTGLIVVGNTIDDRRHRATTRADRCREVENGQRCALRRDHDGPHHMMTTG